MVRSLTRGLQAEGYTVDVATDGEQGLQMALDLGPSYDAILLDLMLPKVNGYAITESLRSSGSRVPVLMLTAKQGEFDQTKALDTGADDYLSKPFEPRELVLRIRNVLQRRPADDPVRRELRFGGCRFDLVRGELYRGGDPVHLTAAEAALLSALAQKAPQPVPREELALSAQFSGNVRNVDVQMTRLRRKIERDPRFPRYLQTVRGTGYALRPD